MIKEGGWKDFAEGLIMLLYLRQNFWELGKVSNWLRKEIESESLSKLTPNTLWNSLKPGKFKIILIELSSRSL